MDYFRFFLEEILNEISAGHKIGWHALLIYIMKSEYLKWQATLRHHFAMPFPTNYLAHAEWWTKVEGGGSSNDKEKFGNVKAKMASRPDETDKLNE